VSGELVTGNIVCEAVGPISANGIDLKISGYEKTEWHDMQYRTEIIRQAEPPSDYNPSGSPAEVSGGRRTHNRLCGNNWVLMMVCCVCCVCIRMLQTRQIAVFHRHRGKHTFFVRCLSAQW